MDDGWVLHISHLQGSLAILILRESLLITNIKFQLLIKNDPTSCGAFTGVTVNFSHENFKKLVCY